MMGGGRRRAMVLSAAVLVMAVMVVSPVEGVVSSHLLRRLASSPAPPPRPPAAWSVPPGAIPATALVEREAATVQKKPKITAELCNGVPCEEIGKPLPEAPPPPRVHHRPAAAAPAPAPAPATPAPAPVKTTESSPDKTMPLDAERREADSAVFDAAPKVTTEPPPAWCADSQHATDPECLRALPNRFDGHGARGPTGRRHMEGYHSLFKPGPVGRRPNPEVKATFVAHLNTTGDSPLGRISAEQMAELMDRKVHPWLYKPRDNRTRTWYNLDESNDFGRTGEASSPVGRLDGAAALRALEDARKNQNEEEQKVWRSDEKTGPEGEDLAPLTRVKWMHWDTFQELERKRRAGEPAVTRTDNGFRHSNDRDFENFSYKKGVRVLPPLNDGPEFNLDNALNHPERLLSTLSATRPAPEAAAGHPGEDFPGAANAAVEASDERVDPATGKIVPHVVDTLPGAAALESPVTGGDSVEANAEDWASQYSVRAAMAPGREPGVARDVVDDDQREAARQDAAPRDPAYKQRREGDEAQPGQQEQQEQQQQQEQGEEQQATGGNPEEQAAAIQAQLKEMQARQQRVEREVLSTRAQIHAAGVAAISERIRSGYGDDTAAAAVAAGRDAGDVEAEAATAQQAAQIAAQLERVRLKQLAVQEQVSKTQHRLVSRLPVAHLREIRERIRRGYADVA